MGYRPNMLVILAGNTRDEIWLLGNLDWAAVDGQKVYAYTTNGLLYLIDFARARK
ncbi:MAG: hypothetical protein IMF26_04885 [Candidatus Fermentithermobacillus carboniphilus]|uniref:Uncharacterized protein n=1 Tax=Candidatus Fermentithermobacillus carboniphilus TaxID=3085328 RepID=A0AAT9LED0_9FIRM|nr:MAG: hypothetical protein IMF26_04885 [Candidatus Fermentithermobacillus carboniphilus]